MNMPNDINNSFDSSRLSHHTDRTTPVEHLSQKTLEPIDHNIKNAYINSTKVGSNGDIYVDPRVIKERNDTEEHFASVSDHMYHDPGVNFNEKDLLYEDVKVGSESNELYESLKGSPKSYYHAGKKKFVGSATMVNSEQNPIKEEILKTSMSDYDKKWFNSDFSDAAKDKDPPLSPLRPFMSLDPGKDGRAIDLMHKSIFTSYNRTLLPIADVEFRKGFRHIFFNRPECYIMCERGNRLSEQAEHDPDFTSSYSRMPHICRLLSPVYLDKSYFTSNYIQSNWNYLLCNRIINISDDFKTSISVKENVTKSIEQHTVVTGGTLESTQGGTISITFRDTKNLEVYEFLRLWMLYIHKIRKGTFAPSYNGYQYQNNFLPFSESNESIDITSENYYHPYDRALDYAASLFQLITNESMFKIIHWTKWYGIYPVEATLNGLNSDHSSMLTGEATVSTVFRYQKKEIDKNLNLVEFNYNAGLCDCLGRPLSKNLSNASYVSNELIIDKPDVEDIINKPAGYIKSYIGPNDLFTGTPYIVLGSSPANSIDGTDALVPYLKFSGVDDVKINDVINVSLTSRTNASGEAIICAT